MQGCDDVGCGSGLQGLLEVGVAEVNCLNPGAGLERSENVKDLMIARNLVIVVFLS